MNRGHQEDGGWDIAALQPFHFHSNLLGWLVSQMKEKLVPGLLPADESNWIHLGSVHLRML